MVKTIFIEGFWGGNIDVDDTFFDALKPYKKILIFSAVNFIPHLEKVKKLLEKNNHEVNVVKSSRASCEGQILGCDSYSCSNKIHEKETDLILYIGDGLFHVEALLLSQIYHEKEIPVFQYNPVEKKLTLKTIQDISSKIKKIKSNLLKFTFAKKIGILVSTKPGQEYLDKAIQLKKKLEQEHKTVFLFLDNTFDLNKTEDYPYIDCWVNSACPRIGQDDCLISPKPIINVKEAFDVNTYLSNIKNG